MDRYRLNSRRVMMNTLIKEVILMDDPTGQDPRHHYRIDVRFFDAVSFPKDSS